MLKNKEKIRKFLHQNNIRKYEINDDHTVDVYQTVDLRSRNLTEIPIQFGIVEGAFNCSRNNLKTLNGCPRFIRGSFDCSYNELTSLEHAPEISNTNVYGQKINSFFKCDNNEIATLEGCPEIVKGYFDCSVNNLTSLEGGPKVVYGNYSCGHNELISLEGAPEKVEGSFYCENNKLTSLEYGPEIVGSFYVCTNNNIKSMKHLPLEVEGRFFHDGIEEQGIEPNTPLEDLHKRNDIINSKQSLEEEFKSKDLTKEQIKRPKMKI